MPFSVPRVTGLVIVYINKSRVFKYAKSSFYRAANRVFAKIGRIASEEVILQLIRIICVPAAYCCTA